MLVLLERVPEAAINRTVRILLDLHETWENSNKEERKYLVGIMLQEVNVDVVTNCILWVKVRQDYEPIFLILEGLDQDTYRRFWIEYLEANEGNCEIETDTRHMSTSDET